MSSETSQFAQFISGLMPEMELQDFTGAIRFKMRTEKKASSDGKITDRLRSCAAQWQQYASQNQVRLTDALVIWTILTTSNVFEETLAAFRNDATTLVKALVDKLVSLLTPISVVHPPVRNLGSYLSIVQANADKDYLTHHTIMMANALTSLADCIEENSSFITHVAVVVGMMARPIEKCHNSWLTTINMTRPIWGNARC